MTFIICRCCIGKGKRFEGLRVRYSDSPFEEPALSGAKGGQGDVVKVIVPGSRFQVPGSMVRKLDGS